jgi:hypothetical protein
MLTTLEEVREFRQVVEIFPHLVASHVWIVEEGGARFVPCGFSGALQKRGGDNSIPTSITL